MLSTIEKVLFLKSVDFFNKIPSEDLALIAQIAEEEEFFEDDYIITQGETGSDMYIIVEGEVRVLIGEGTEVARLGEKQCVGEMSLLDAEPRSASVVAANDVKVLKIGQESFYDILYERTEIVQGVISLLIRRLREANKK
ncbi:MAG: cyclic nucleotide-binding domain-containing protein [Planctomycetota bacterium]|jgi:CRP-like cAMP-binding protein|nr:cyclic nucleotide-binding domain-containing protein [Planctomycetota bacterium]